MADKVQCWSGQSHKAINADGLIYETRQVWKRANDNIEAIGGLMMLSQSNSALKQENPNGASSDLPAHLSSARSAEAELVTQGNATQRNMWWPCGILNPCISGFAPAPLRSAGIVCR